MALSILALLPLIGCAAAPDPQIRHARRGGPGPVDSAVDTQAQDTAVDDTGADTGTPPDPWADDDTTVNPVYGVDVSHWNGAIDWYRAAADGVVFAIAKSTEGDYYTDDAFPGEYDGAFDAGLIRGAYHFAIPDDTDGATQAAFFVENGGDWWPDGQTLPGVLDIEYNPYGDTCYGLSKGEMAAWVDDFSQTYIGLTGRAPLIYTNADWWNSCVGSSDVPAIDPLWVAYWSSGSPALPSGWGTYTFWQYADDGTVDGISDGVDMDRFPGSLHDLRMFANDTE